MGAWLGLSLVWVAPSTLHAQAAPAQAPIKIICIGDSTTQGGRAGREEYTYRLPLYRFLKQKGFAIEFIGARQQGLSEGFTWPADFDPHHEGFYGAKTAEIRDALKRDLPKVAPPDVALLDVGSNDEGTDTAETVAVPLADMIADLRRRNPKVKILVGQIPGMWKNLGMHVHIWRLVHELSTDASPIATVPVYMGWNQATDTFDGDHPNIQGQVKMAKRYLSVLEPLLASK